MNDPTHGENVETAGASSSSSSPVDTRADEGLPPTYNITNADKVKLGLIYSLGMPLTSRFEAGAHADPLDDGLAYDEEIVQREKKEHPETDHHTADGPITDADYDDLHEAFGGISLNEHSDAGLPKGLDASLPIDNSVSNTASTLTSTYVSTTTAAASTISTPMKLASLSSSPAKPKRFWGGSVTDLVRSLRGPTSSITSHSISTTTNATASSSLSTSSDSNINAAGAKVDPTPAQIAYLSTCRYVQGKYSRCHLLLIHILLTLISCMMYSLRSIINPHTFNLFRVLSCHGTQRLVMRSFAEDIRHARDIISTAVTLWSSRGQ